MFFNFSSFIVYFISYLFNKLYFNIFSSFKIFLSIKLYSIYTIKEKILYFVYFFLLCVLVFCKIYFFSYYYILIIYKLLVRIYITLIYKIKKKSVKFLYFVFWVY